MTSADRGDEAIWQVAGADVSRLQPGEVHVWRMTLAADASPSSVEDCRLLLSQDECARAARFRTETLRTSFVLCHGALRRVLARYSGAAPAAIEFDYERHGKPVLRPSASRRAIPLHFNLSHSGELGLAAVSTQAIGVDVEQVRPMADADRLAHQFFSPSEYDAIRSLPVAERTEAFFRCWTRKEAFVKAVGEGLSYPLATFAVSLQAEASALRHVAGAPGEADEWSLPMVTPAVGYIAAIAIRRRQNSLSFFELPHRTNDT